MFHVALTRARAQVFVLADAEAPSPFIGELDGSRSHRPPPPPAGRSATGREGGGAGRQRTRRPPSSPESGDAGVEPTAASAAAERSLREWRSAVAKREAVPAYVVLNDKELIGLASVLPRTLAELATCRGIGPLRLERWGDEILAVLDAGEA